MRFVASTLISTAPEADRAWAHRRQDERVPVGWYHRGELFCRANGNGAYAIRYHAK